MTGRMICGGCPHLPEILDKSDSILQKTAISNRYFIARSASGPGRVLKKQNGHFPSHLDPRKSICYKISLRENSQRQGYKAFTIASLNEQKWLAWNVPFCLKFRLSPCKNTEFQSIFARSTATLREKMFNYD